MSPKYLILDYNKLATVGIYTCLPNIRKMQILDFDHLGRSYRQNMLCSILYPIQLSPLIVNISYTGFKKPVRCFNMSISLEFYMGMNTSV